MSRWIVLIVLLLNSLTTSVLAEQAGGDVTLPDIPRVSAFEAYQKYKAGKAIIIQAGGISYEKRHIIGAILVEQEDVTHGRTPLPDFPTEGIEIFTYCY